MPGERADGPGSSGARVYLHLRARRGYLKSVVGPEARRLEHQYQAEQVHVRSGWLGGPHFDLRAEGVVDWDAVAVALAAGARDYPATEIAEADYLRQAAELGRVEAVPPPYRALRNHGQAEVIGPSPSESRLGVGGRACMLPALLQSAAAESEGVLRARVAEAFLALADCHPHGLRFGTFSFRSHAEAFFHWAGPAADYRALFTTRLEEDLPVLAALVRRVQDGAESGPASAWRQAFQLCMATFAGQVSESDLDAIAGDPSLRRPEGRSPFHTIVAESGLIDESPAWFPAFRLTINLFYQLLPALDISPVQRFYLCHAVAEAVDAVCGETWQDRLVAVEAHLAAAR